MHDFGQPWGEYWSMQIRVFHDIPENQFYVGIFEGAERANFVDNFIE